MSEMLHVFNGDMALREWLGQGRQGRTLVWRENYLLGVLPPPDLPAEEFIRLRAKVLHFYNPEFSEEQIRNEFLREDAALRALRADDSVCFWFDRCMYDQLMLARLFYRLDTLDAPPGTVLLSCEDRVCCQETPFPISRRLLHLGATAWRAASGGKETIEVWLRENPPEKVWPWLFEGMERFLADQPDGQGMTRTLRQLTALIPPEGIDPDTVFRKFADCEKRMFMGDTHCWGLLDDLAERGLLRMENARKVLGCTDRARRKIRLYPNQ